MRAIAPPRGSQYNEPVRLSRRRQPGACVTLAHSWLSTLAAYPLITQP